MIGYINHTVNEHRLESNIAKNDALKENGSAENSRSRVRKNISSGINFAKYDSVTATGLDNLNLRARYTVLTSQEGRLELLL